MKKHRLEHLELDPLDMGSLRSARQPVRVQLQQLPRHLVSAVERVAAMLERCRRPERHRLS